MLIVDMNRSSEVSIGFIYLSCSVPTHATSNNNNNERKIEIEFVVGSILTFVIISVAALCKITYARALHRSKTVRSDLNHLAPFELQC